MVRWRSRILGLSYPEIRWELLGHPYREESHLDLRILLGNGNRAARGTLQVWADAFGVPARECGALVEGWVHNGNWTALREYGESEAATLVLMYERITGAVEGPSSHIGEGAGRETSRHPEDT